MAANFLCAGPTTIFILVVVPILKVKMEVRVVIAAVPGQSEAVTVVTAVPYKYGLEAI